MWSDWLLLAWLPALLFLILGWLVWRRWSWRGLVGLVVLLTLIVVDLWRVGPLFGAWFTRQDWTRYMESASSRCCKP